MFHVKRRHKNPPLHDFGPCRGGFSARSFSIPAGSRKECLSGRGNADDIFKILIRFAFPALGLDAVLFHHIDGMVDGIHKDTHITDDDAAARFLRLIRRPEKLLYVMFCLCDVHTPLRHNLQSGKPFLLLFQSEKSACMTFRQLGLGDDAPLLLAEPQKAELVGNA